MHDVPGIDLSIDLSGMGLLLVKEDQFLGWHINKEG